jgi:hypothetical protein
LARHPLSLALLAAVIATTLVVLALQNTARADAGPGAMGGK